MLQRFERRLGGLVEGAFAKVFKGGVEPVELAGALTRECDDRKVSSAKRTLVPNDFVIHLSDADFQRLAPYRQALGDELATLVREHAEAQRYTFVAPVVVNLESDPELSVGRYEVSSAVAGEPAGRSDIGRDIGMTQRPTQIGAEPPDFAKAPVPPRVPPPVIPQRSAASRPTNPTAARPQQPKLIISVGGAEGQQRTVELTRPLTVVGRGSDVDVQLADTGTSRRHGELILQADGRHSYRDLGSTNGSKVNGRQVHEAPLVDGDRIEIGRSVLVYRHPTPLPRPAT